jgi:hypothetical protein
MFAAKNPLALTIYKLQLRARRSPQIASIEQIELEASRLSDEDKQHSGFGDLQVEIARAKARISGLSNKRARA